MIRRTVDSLLLFQHIVAAEQLALLFFGVVVLALKQLRREPDHPRLALLKLAASVGELRGWLAHALSEDGGVLLSHRRVRPLEESFLLREVLHFSFYKYVLFIYLSPRFLDSRLLGGTPASPLPLRAHYVSPLRAPDLIPPKTKPAPVSRGPRNRRATASHCTRQPESTRRRIAAPAGAPRLLFRLRSPPGEVRLVIFYINRECQCLPRTTTMTSRGVRAAPLPAPTKS